MRLWNQGRPGLVALLVVLFTTVGGAPAASAADPTLTIREGVGVQARGAGLAFDVAFTCATGGRGGRQIAYTVAQEQADGSVVSAQGVRRISCTGTEQVARLIATTVGTFNPYCGEDCGTPGRPTGAPFRAGTATVTAVLSHCEAATGCRTATASRTVQAPAVTLDAARLTTHATASLPSTARREADGAGATARLTYRCPAGVRFRVESLLVQRTSAGAVTSSARAEYLPTCTGADQSHVLAFHADAAAWRAGSALLIVDGFSIRHERYVRRGSGHRTLTLG